MALRNQPYLPLFVQDFLTDEKLIECSAEATGVYIRLMCIMHKSDEYGTILLKQKDKQTDKQINNFALKLAKHLPYDLLLIERCLIELISENVLQIDDDYLIQKRMVKDNYVSNERSLAGKKGGINRQKNINNFALAKCEANTETEIEYITDNKIINKENNVKKTFLEKSKLFYENEINNILEAEILKSSYQSFVNYIFIEKNISKELLSLENQLLFSEYKILLENKIYTKELFKNTLDAMINTPLKLKGKKSFYLTIRNWMNRAINK
jgi:hypothetical protein